MPGGGAFQHYSILQTNLVSAIPDALSFEDACVLPLATSTAACGLFQRDFLALQYPSVQSKPTGKTLLIWGGSTAVGSAAIQLGVAAGYEVITTASPKNFEYVKKLGASATLDYRSPYIVEELIEACKGKVMAGAIPIASAAAAMSPNNVFQSCCDVLLKSEGSKFIAAAMRLPEIIPEGISTKFIWGGTLKDNEVGKVVYEDYLPKALAEGAFIAAPEAVVVGKGLGSIHDAFEIQKRGVSAKKIVITL
jgi:NADPH:quinone reductase-like Zn-dependent oxidoreductase